MLNFGRVPARKIDMSPELVTGLKGNESSSDQHFSGEMVVVTGVSARFLKKKLTPQITRIMWNPPKKKQVESNLQTFAKVPAK